MKNCRTCLPPSSDIPAVECGVASVDREEKLAIGGQEEWIGGASRLGEEVERVG